MIHTATAAEADDVLALIVAQFDEHAIPAPVDRLRDAVVAVLNRPELGVFLLARDEDGTVGVAYLAVTWSLEHCGRTSWLEELYVVPSKRGRGIGEKLLQAALAEARQRRCAAVDLEVERNHKRAESLYRRAGFEPLPRARWVRRSDAQSI